MNTITHSTLMTLGIIWAAGWTALTVMAWSLRTRQLRKQAGWGVILMIIAIAFGLRLMAITADGPTLSDDLWRYVHDGYTLASGDSPYQLAPDEHEKTTMPWAKYINHRHLVTIYQPTSQWFFAGLWLAGDKLQQVAGTSTTWTHAMVFRLGFVLFDLLIISLLIVVLKGHGRSVWWTTLYAWHPMPILEIGSSGHQDVIGMMWLLLCMVLLNKDTHTSCEQNACHSKWIWSSMIRVGISGAAFALACGVKPIVAPLMLPLAWQLRRRPLSMICAATTATISLAILYLPFGLMEGGLGRLLETVQIFTHHWRFNGSLHSVAEMLSGSKTVADITAGLLLVGLLALWLRYGLDTWRIAGFYFLWTILLSSTAHPWYLLWALVFIPIIFQPATWILSLTIGWSYVALLDRETYLVPTWIRLAQYLPVYIAICWSLMTRSSQSRLQVESTGRTSGPDKNRPLSRMNKLN